MFSARSDWDLGESGLSVAVRVAREGGIALVDLTLSNPTACGFNYGEGLLGPLGNADGVRYDPDPRGLKAARQAVAGYYREHGAVVDAGDVLLTTSTSEGYSFLLRLLCDVGDEVLVAQPGYPLFDYLATLNDVALRFYPLFYDFGWWIDFHELEQRITPRTKAVLLVHPNNPTGHTTAGAERERLETLCAKRGLTLIVDEVFLDYGLAGTVRSFASGPHECLKFVVSGLSKIAGLPQMKVAWLAGFGPEALRTEALGRLEVIADTYLSLNAPAQLALGSWLAGRDGIAAQIRERVRANLAVLTAADGLVVLPVEAGWSAVVNLPQGLAGEGLAERLVEEAGVVVHPAEFYGMAGAHRVVVSLIVPEREFAEGVRRLVGFCKARAL